MSVARCVTLLFRVHLISMFSSALSARPLPALRRHYVPRYALTPANPPLSNAPFLSCSSKIYELDEELHIVGNNLKTITVQVDQVSLLS